MSFLDRQTFPAYDVRKPFFHQPCVTTNESSWKKLSPRLNFVKFQSKPFLSDRFHALSSQIKKAIQTRPDDRLGSPKRKLYSVNMIKYSTIALQPVISQ